MEAVRCLRNPVSEGTQLRLAAFRGRGPHGGEYRGFSLWAWWGLGLGVILGDWLQ